MLFSNNKLAKKHLAFALLLLIILTAVPLLSVQASVSLKYFRTAAGPSSIKLEWETAQELDNLGFNLYRGLSDDFQAATKLNGGLIAGNTGSTTGAYYDWIDNDVQIDTIYYYWLEDIDINGVETLHGPETGSLTGGSGFPTTVPPGGGNSTATPTPSQTPTRTPTATTQSGTAAAQTPTRTPNPSPTTASSSANSTATIAPQVQATSASNNTTTNTTTQVQGSPTESVATAQPDENNPAEPAEPTILASDPEPEATLEAVAQVPNGGERETSDGVTAPSIGEGGNTEETVENSVDGESGRSPVVLMAFIISVILLFVGGGGVVALLINRNKANEDLRG